MAEQTQVTPSTVTQDKEKLERAMVILAPFLAAEGLEGQLLNPQAAKVYDAAVAALSLNEHGVEAGGDAYDIIRRLLTAINDIPAEECPASLNEALTATFAFLDKPPASLNREGPSEQCAHEWIGPEGVTACRLCGVKRRDLAASPLNRVSIADETLEAKKRAAYKNWLARLGTSQTSELFFDAWDSAVAALSSTPAPIEDTDNAR